MIRILLFVCFSVLSILIPSLGHAYDNPYYAQAFSVRSGSEIVRFVAAARFVHERLYPDPSDSAAFLCSISKLIPENRGAAFLETVAQSVFEISGIPQEHVIVVLTSHPCPKMTVTPLKPVAKQKSLQVDKKGSVVSSNPVWNACIRNVPMTADFIRSNPDTFLHRQRRVSVNIPLSCRDYHRGQLTVWSLPSDSAVHVVLDSRGRLLGDPPIGYVLVRE